MSTEAIAALSQRIKDLAVNSTPDQLAYLAKALESIRDKKAISEIEQMTEIKKIIDAIQKRLKDLAASSTPDQLAYLAKALESIIDKSSVSEIVQMADEKLRELLSSTRSHLSDIDTNKTSSISAITGARTESISEINTLRTSSLDALKESSDLHISLLDTRKNTNITAINSTGIEQLEAIKGVVKRYETAIDVPSGSSVIKEIETRDNQLKTSIINEVKTRDNQLKSTFEIISDPEILLNTINNNNLESWLSNTDNRRKFSKMLSNASAVFNITGYPSALNKLIGSPKATEELIKSNVALNIMVNTVAINTLMSSSSILANSGKALYMIVRSEIACRTIENSIQSYRSRVISTLEASSLLFRKQTGVKVGSGASTQESGRNSATIYIPTACRDDNDTDFSVNSLLTGNRLAYIARHSNVVNINSGIALRGVKVSGTGGTVGEVIFDVYTVI